MYGASSPPPNFEKIKLGTYSSFARPILTHPVLKETGGGKREGETRY